MFNNLPRLQEGWDGDYHDTGSNKAPQDEIIRMAREAGALVFRSNFCDSSFDFNLEQIERFFNLAFAAGAAHEREACAKSVYDSTDWAHEERDMVLKEAIAAAIRARK